MLGRRAPSAKEVAIRLDPRKLNDLPLFKAPRYDLDRLPGLAYRQIDAAVGLAARFDGEEDHLDGDCQLVMFENKVRPILGGRELLGVPKQQTDISRIRQLPDGSLRCEASL